jgi:hypothetical protein
MVSERAKLKRQTHIQKFTSDKIEQKRKNRSENKKDLAHATNGQGYPQKARRYSKGTTYGENRW